MTFRVCRLHGVVGLAHGLEHRDRIGNEVAPLDVDEFGRVRALGRCTCGVAAEMLPREHAGDAFDHVHGARTHNGAETFPFEGFVEGTFMLTAIALNCTLKPRTDGEESSTDKMIGVLADALKAHDVTLAETVRVAALDIKPGVTSDEGDGDEWPDLRRRLLAADILIVGTPIWMGQMSSIAKRVLERMDAFLSETDDQGRTPAFGKVAMAAIVGNEDGAHAITANLFQALNDVGYSLAPWASVYWVGEARGSVDFRDLDGTPDKVAQAAAGAVAQTAHLAKLLKANAYPGSEK